jgi:serine/threonine-protein kinase
VDGRSDQFSLAVIAFEMLTGEKPFVSEQLASLAYNIAHQDPPVPSKLNPGLNWQVDLVLQRALQKGPAARFKSCTEFVNALEAACKSCKGWKPLARGATQNLPTLAVKPAEEKSAGARMPPARPTPSRRGRRTLIAVILLVLAAAVVLVAGAAWLGHWLPLRTPGETPRPEAVAPVAPAARPSPVGPAAAKPEAETPPPPATTPETSPEPKPGAAAEAPPAATPPPRAGTQPATTTSRTEPRLPPEAIVLMRTSPEGADVTFDDDPQLRCKSPCSMPLSSGRHTAAANLEGYRPALRIFRLPDEDNIYLYLAKLTGQVQVLSDPAGAAVLVDGQRRRETTPATFELPVGKHIVGVAREGYQPDQQEIEVKDSAFLRLTFTLGR